MRRARQKTALVRFPTREAPDTIGPSRETASARWQDRRRSRQAATPIPGRGLWMRRCWRCTTPGRLPIICRFRQAECRKRRSQRFAESSSTAPTKAELVIWSWCRGGAREGRCRVSDPSVGSHIANSGYG